ncbi:MAG: hypothetical protein JXR63_13465 [Spirochaetales bacterium]|nr:hypothetical protein [Spirochaetales bacterium]
MKKKFLFILLVLFALFACKQKSFFEKLTDEDNTANSGADYETVGYLKLAKVAILPPRNVKAAFQSQEAGYVVRVTWDLAQYSSKYIVERADDNGGSPGEFVEILETEAREHKESIDLGDSGSKIFYYRVISINSAGTRSYPSNVASVAVSKQDFSSRTLAGSVSVSKGAGFVKSEFNSSIFISSTIEISWDKVSGASYYKIWRAVAGEDVSAAVVVCDKFFPTDAMASRLKFRDQESSYGLEDGLIYRYWVVPHNRHDSMGGGSVEVNASDTGFMFGLPREVVCSQGKDGGGIDVSWQYPNFGLGIEPSGFVLYRSTRMNDGFEVVSDIIAPGQRFYTDDAAVVIDDKPTSYYYKIAARFGSVESKSSFPASRGESIASDALCPPASYNLIASKATTDQLRDKIVVTIPRVDGAESYCLYQSGSETSGYMPLYSFDADPSNPPSYTFTFFSEKDELQDMEKDGLVVGRLYYFKVSVIGSNGKEGGKSVDALGLTVRAPENLEATVSSEGVGLSWDPLEVLPAFVNNVSYRVFRSIDGENFVQVSGDITDETSFIDKFAAEGSEFYYSVRAVSNSSSSDDSNIVTVMTRGFPSDLEVSKAVVGSGINLTWSNVDDPAFTEYRIYRSEIDSAPIQGVGYFASDTNSYFDESVEVGKVYYYFVSAFYFNGHGNESSLCPSDFGYLLGSPESVFASDGTFTDKVVVRWTKVLGAESYRVRATLVDGSHNIPDVVEVLGGDSLSCEFTVPLGNSYNIAVCALNAGGEVGAWSADAFGSTIVEPGSIPAPTGVTASDSFADKVRVSWDVYANPPGMTLLGFEIYKNGLFQFEVGSSNTYADVGIDAAGYGVTDYYAVQAVALDVANNRVVGIRSDFAAGKTLSVPENVIASNGIFSDRIRISWSPVDNAGGYYVEWRAESEEFDASRRSEVTLASLSDPSNPFWDFMITDSSTQVGVDLIFRVLVYGADSNVAVVPSIEDFGYVLGVPEELFTNSEVSFSSIEVSWTSVPRAAGYRVYRTDNLSNPWTDTGASVMSAGENKWKIIDSDVVPFVRYYYSVQALSLGGEGYIDESNNIFNYIVASPEISVSNFGIPASGGDDGENGDSALVTWDISSLNSADSNFAIRIVLVEDFPGGSESFEDISDRGVTSKTFEGLTPGNDYVVKAYAVVADVLSPNLDDLDGDANPDNWKRFSPVLNSPAVTGKNGDFSNVTDHIELTWNSLTTNPSDDAIIAYRVYRTKKLQGAETIWGAPVSTITESANSTLTFSELNNGNPNLPSGAYFYKVVSLNRNNCEGVEREVLALYNRPSKVSLATTLATQDCDGLTEEIRLTWKHIGGVDYYRLYIAYLDPSFGADPSVARISATGFNNNDDMSYSVTTFNGSPIELGYYYFKLVPVVSKVDNGWGTPTPDMPGPEMDTHIRGVKSITDEQWISGVLNEMRRCYYEMYNGSSHDFNSIDRNQWYYGTNSSHQQIPGLRVWRLYSSSSSWSVANTSRNNVWDLYHFGSGVSGVNYTSQTGVFSLKGMMLYMYMFEENKDYYVAETVGGSPETHFRSEARSYEWTRNYTDPGFVNQHDNGLWMDWFEVGGAYPGQFKLHGRIKDGWNYGTLDSGVNHTLKLAGNLIYKNCDANAGDSGCPNKYAHPDGSEHYKERSEGLWLNYPCIISYGNVWGDQNQEKGWNHHEHGVVLKRKTSSGDLSTGRIYDIVDTGDDATYGLDYVGEQSQSLVW